MKDFFFFFFIKYCYRSTCFILYTDNINYKLSLQSTFCFCVSISLKYVINLSSRNLVEVGESLPEQTTGEEAQRG